MIAIILAASIEAAQAARRRHDRHLPGPGHRARRQGDLRHPDHRRRHLPRAHHRQPGRQRHRRRRLSRRRIVRYAIIALFTAIGLTFMGLADQIVMLAFGLILGSAAVATALAFGLGGRDAAARVARTLGGRIAGPPAPPPAPRRIRSAPPSPTTASRLWSDMTFDEAVAFALTLPDTELGDQLRQAGGQGRVERPRLPVPKP